MSDHNNWKPGDVAMVTRDDGHEAVAVRGRRAWSQSGPDGRTTLVRHAEVTRIRPLVVIDPEDREQVERLLDLLNVSGMHRGAMPHAAAGMALADALREYAATPTKPDEPMQWLAVVEDRDGHRWFTHRNDLTIKHETPWYCQELEEYRDYRDIPAVRVLSEGVTE